MKIVDYDIITGSSTKEVKQKVKDNFCKGWVLLGSIFITYALSSSPEILEMFFNQIMVKYDDQD